MLTIILRNYEYCPVPLSRWILSSGSRTTDIKLPLSEDWNRIACVFETQSILMNQRASRATSLQQASFFFFTTWDQWKQHPILQGTTLVLVQDVSCCGRCDVSKLAMLCVKGKRVCVAPRLRACARTEPETVGNRRLSHNNATHRRRTCTCT